MEACDDSGGSCAPDISHENHGFISDNDMPAVQQVNSFISNSFCSFRILLDASGHFISGLSIRVQTELECGPTHNMIAAVGMSVVPSVENDDEFRNSISCTHRPAHVVQ